MQNFNEKVNAAHNDRLGRHFVANMNIEAGETLLEERPLFVATHWDAGQMKCANCYRDSFMMCKKCEVFPLCMDCKVHDNFDCGFFITADGAKISKNVLVKNYATHAALKLLLLMENPNTDAACQQLFMPQLAVDNYRETEMWQEHAEQVVAPLLASGIADAFTRTQLNAELLHKLCITIDAHAFEVTARDGDSLKGIYVAAAQLPHHCTPNTVVSLDEDFNMKIYAAFDIKSGEVIYNSYVNPLMGTSQRQHQLRMSRRIDCQCTRCLDPTELGTHMSTLKCKECAGGLVVCEAGISGNWICNKCHATTTAKEVRRLLAEVGEAMASANGDVHVYEELLAKYANEFHPHHFLLVDIKENITSILHAALIMGSTLTDPAKKLLERRLQLCEELLPVVRAVQPGISKLYAIALYEYLLPFLELAELEFQASDIPKESYCRKLELARCVCGKALEMLRFEPTNSPEGQMVQRLIMEQKRIEEELTKINVN